MENNEKGHETPSQKIFWRCSCW